MRVELCALCQARESLPDHIPKGVGLFVKLTKAVELGEIFDSYNSFTHCSTLQLAERRWYSAWRKAVLLLAVCRSHPTPSDDICELAFHFSEIEEAGKKDGDGK